MPLVCLSGMSDVKVLPVTLNCKFGIKIRAQSDSSTAGVGGKRQIGEFKWATFEEGPIHGDKAAPAPAAPGTGETFSATISREHKSFPML